MAVPQTPKQYAESRDMDIENAFKIVGVVLLFLVLMVVLRFVVNMFIDLAILRDADSMIRALSQVRRFFCPCWHPRTQNLNPSPSDSLDAGNARRTEVEISPNQITIGRLLGNLTSEQRQLLVSKVIPTHVASVMDLEKWKHQDDQHDLVPTMGKQLSPKRGTENEQEGSDSADGSHGATLLCPICIHDIEPGNRIVSLEDTCRHRFHSECLFQWLSTQTRDCPYCRCTILTQEMMNRAHQHRREVLLQTRDSKVQSTDRAEAEDEDHANNETRQDEDAGSSDIENQS